MDRSLGGKILLGAMLVSAYFLIERLGPRAVALFSDHPDDPVFSNSWTFEDLRHAFTAGKTTKAEVVQYLNQHGIPYKEERRPPLGDALYVSRSGSVHRDPILGSYRSVVLRFDNNGILTSII